MQDRIPHPPTNNGYTNHLTGVDHCRPRLPSFIITSRLRLQRRRSGLSRTNPFAHSTFQDICQHTSTGSQGSSSPVSTFATRHCVSATLLRIHRTSMPRRQLKQETSSSFFRPIHYTIRSSSSHANQPFWFQHYATRVQQVETWRTS